MSFDEEIQFVRTLAEQRVGVPDFGIGQDQQPQKNRTATEVNRISTVMQQSNDLFCNDVGGHRLVFAPKVGCQSAAGM